MKRLLMIAAVLLVSVSSPAQPMDAVVPKPKIVWKRVSQENCGKLVPEIRCRVQEEQDEKRCRATKGLCIGTACGRLRTYCDSYYLGLRDDGEVAGWMFLSAVQDRITEAMAVKLDCSAMTSPSWVRDGICASVGPGGKIAELDKKP